MFEPCRMESHIWLRTYGEDHYKNIALSTDGLLIDSKDLKGTTNVLTNENSFKLIGTGPISHHLGCDFGLNDDGTLHLLHKNHIEKMVTATAACLVLNLSSTSHHL